MRHTDEALSYRHSNEARSSGGGQAGAVYAEGTRLIYPQTIVDNKNRVDAKMRAVNFDVAQCGALDVASRSDWNDFFLAWRKFYCRDDAGLCEEPDYSIWGLGSQMDDIETFEGQLYDWQNKLSGMCKLGEPIGPRPRTTADQPDDTSTLVRDVVIGLGILGGIYVISQTGLPRIFPRTGGKR